MSEIKKYKKYLNFKANPRYLTRDFIVPLYTGTEPDIYEDKKPNINDQEMIVDPSMILPKNFTDDMPFAPQQNISGQQLELADGGSVERQEFIMGGTVASMPKELKPLFKKEYPNKKWEDLKPYQRNNLKVKFEKLNPGIKLSESKFPGLAYERSDVLKIIKDKLKDTVEEKNGFKVVNWSEEKTNPMLIKEFKKNNIKLTNREFINKAITKVFEQNNWIDPLQYRREMVVDSFMKHLYNVGEFDGEEKLAEELKPFLGKPGTKDLTSKKFENINRDFNDWRKGKFEVSNVDRNALDKSSLKEIKNWMPRQSNQRVAERRKQLEFLDKLNDKNISLDEAKKQFKKEYSNLQDPLKTFNQRVSQLTTLKLEGKLPSNQEGDKFKIYKNIKVGERAPWLKQGLTDNYTGNYSKLIQAADTYKTQGKIKEADRLYNAAEKFFSPNKGIFSKAGGQAEHPFSRVWGGVDQQLKINSLVKGDLNSFKRSNFDEPVIKDINNYRKAKTAEEKDKFKKAIEIRKNFMNYITGSKEFGGIVDPVEFTFTPKDVEVKTNIKPIDKIKNLNVELFKQRGEAYGQSAKTIGEELGLLTKEGELSRRKISTNKMQDILNNIKNAETKVALNFADELSKEDARAVCGKLTLGGLPKGCAELAKEDPEKFLKTVAETTKDAGLATKANQAFNTAKKIVSVADEIVLLGKGVVGRTVAPLTIINSALEQFTAGNYREAYRQVFDFLDPLPLIGISGFEKSRQEGSIENIRGRIGKENQESFNRLLEFKDVYDRLTDVNTKLERAESATQDPNAAPESYDPDYINDLKKQQKDLDKILNSSKYQNIRNDYLNIGKATLKETFSRNVGKPEQDKYAYETSLLETLNRILGPNLFNQFEDENKELSKNKTFVEEVIKKQSELPAPDISTFGGDVGPIVAPINQPQITPLEKTEISPVEQEELPNDYVVSAAEGGYIDYVREYKKYARGGRINLSDGGNGNRPKISRRGFLGFLAGAASAPFVAKLFKGKKGIQAAKIAAKVLPEAKGMPEWFNPLITKIVNEGVDISPKATRVEDIKTIKKLEVPTPDGKGTDTIIMTKYPDGTIEVDAEVLGGGAFDSPFTLTYKPPKLDIDLTTGKPIKDPGSFYVIEQRPKPDYNDPGNFEIDYETMYVDDAISDIERIEKIATGKRIPPQKVEQRTGARKFVESNPSDDIVNRYGDSEIEYDRMKDEGLFDETE